MATQSKFKYRRATPPPEARYKMTFGGIYAAKGLDGGEVHKPYTWDETMSQKQVDRGALHVFCKYIAKARDAKFIAKYPDFLTLKTHDVVGNEPIEETGAELTPHIMTQEQLLDYIAEVHPQIKTELFDDLGALRQAVFDIETDEEAFLKNQEDIALKKGPGVEVMKELRDLRQEQAAQANETASPVAPSASKTTAKGKPTPAEVAAAQGM